MPEDIKENIKPITNLVDKLKGLTSKNASEDEIVKILQQINYLFLNAELKIDGIKIVPLETEIYYHNEQQKIIFEDKMIHKNELQKSRLRQLYFHRYGKTSDSKILHQGGGVDICLSDGDFYLSVLLRTVSINGGEPISGINRIQEQFYYEILKKRILELEEKQITIKVNENISPSDIDPICNQKKYDELDGTLLHLPYNDIYVQKRIQGENYKEGETHKLNNMLLGKNREYLKYSKIKNIIEKQIKEGNYGK